MKARDTFQRLGWGSQGRPRRHPLIAGILILVLVAQFGCASSGTDKRSASSLHFPVPRAAFQEPGKVAIVSGRFTPTFNIDDPKDTPNTFWPTLEELIVGALSPFIVVGLLGLTPIVLLGIPWLIIYQGMTAEPTVETAESAVKVEEQEAATHKIVAVATIQEELSSMTAEPTPVKTAERVDERVAAARELIASQRLQNDLRDRVVAISQLQITRTLTVAADQGPITVDERPGYRLLSQEGIQTVLEVVVESVTLNCDGKWSTSSPLRMDLIVRIRLIRTVDAERIYLNWVTYKGGKERTLEEWGGDPEGLRDELNQAHTDIAERIVKEVFLGTESN